MNVDALTSWLSANPTASEDAPDLVALAQTLARQLEDDDLKPGDVAVVAREYRMVLKELHGLGGGDEGDDFAASLSAPVRDSKGSKP